MTSMDGWTGQLPSPLPADLARLQALGMVPRSSPFTVTITYGSGGSSDTISLGDSTVWTVKSWVLPGTQAKGTVFDADGSPHPFALALTSTPTGHDLTCRINPEEVKTAGNDSGSWSANDGSGMLQEGDGDDGHRRHHGCEALHPQPPHPVAAAG